jgi:hypothetical protein
MPWVAKVTFTSAAMKQMGSNFTSFSPDLSLHEEAH